MNCKEMNVAEMRLLSRSGVLYFRKGSESNLRVRTDLRMSTMYFGYTRTTAFCHKHRQRNICLEFIFSVTNDIGLLPRCYLEEHVRGPMGQWKHQDKIKIFGLSGPDLATSQPYDLP